MRLTKILVGIVLLCILVYVGVTVWPLVLLVLHRPPHEGILTALAIAMVTLHPNESLSQEKYVYVFLAFMIVVAIIVRIDMQLRTSKTHGSARWASRDVTRKYRPSRNRFMRPRRQAVQATGGRPAPFFLLCGKYRGRVVGLAEELQYQHVLLTGPTGTGKSSRFFLPNLLRETGCRSLFIADLKNELYQIAGGWLSQRMQVWLFAPMRPTVSQGYNPLAHIYSVENARDFAETWVSNTGRSQAQTFFDTNSELMIAAMALHLVETEKAPPFFRLSDMLTMRPLDEIVDVLEHSPSKGARLLAGQLLTNMQKNERLVGSQMTDVGNRFQLLASQQVRDLTAINQVDFQEMIDMPIAFFLSIPRSEVRRYRPLMAVLFKQMMTAWERHGTRGIGCYLDEFANIGTVPGFAEFVTTTRSLHVSLIMAIQSFSQLDERYGRYDADTIKSNAATHLLLPGAGLEETRFYSERIGDTTVRTETVHRRGTGFAQEVSVTESEARRRLITADELRTMRPGTMMMLEATDAPVMLQTTPYYQDRELAARANLPCQLTVSPSGTIIQEEPDPTRPGQYAPRGLPAGSQRSATGKQAPPPIIDADDDL